MRLPVFYGFLALLVWFSPRTNCHTCLWPKMRDHVPTSPGPSRLPPDGIST